MPKRGKHYSDFHYPEIQGKLVPRILPRKELFLDVDNPRLLNELEGYSPRIDKAGKWKARWDEERMQSVLTHMIFTHFDLDSLENSLASFGFIPMDNIVVYEREPGKFVVIEGNCRLVCMRELVHRSKYCIRKLPEDILATFENIPVLVLESSDNFEQDVFLLQGMRHVTGVKSWGPYQQAALVFKCVVEKELSFRETGAAIGLSASKASSMFHAYRGCIQAREHPIYGKHFKPTLYSHFDQAYRQLETREWLGWDKESKCYSNAENFAKFMELILDGNPLTGQRPLQAVELRDMFPRVLNNDAAKREFLDGHVSIVQAASLVQNTPNPSQVLRAEIKKIEATLNDLPERFLFSKDGRYDLKMVKGLHGKLEEILMSFAKKQIDWAKTD